MPDGSKHHIVGLLVTDRYALVLRMDGGGEWRLDAPARARQLVGHRVVVTGVRDGFDLLAVRDIRLEGAEHTADDRSRPSGAAECIRTIAALCISLAFPYRSRQ